MSIARGDAAQPRGDTTPTPAPRDRPRLPIVEFHLDEERPLSVHFAAADARQAAQDNPNDDLLDLRGKVLRLVKDGDRGSRLVAGEEGDEDGLRQRVLDVLRRAAELEAAAGRFDKDDVEPVLSWLAAAPDATYLIHGLALAETQEDEDQPVGEQGCSNCTFTQYVRWGTPRCCPR